MDIAVIKRRLKTLQECLFDKLIENEDLAENLETLIEKNIEECLSFNLISDEEFKEIVETIRGLNGSLKLINEENDKIRNALECLSGALFELEEIDSLEQKMGIIPIFYLRIFRTYHVQNFWKFVLDFQEFFCYTLITKYERSRQRMKSIEEAQEIFISTLKNICESWHN